MRLVVDLDEGELAHLLEAIGAVVDVIERRSDELVAAVVLRGVLSKLLRAIEEVA